MPIDPHVVAGMADRLRRWVQQAGENDEAKRALPQAGHALEEMSSKAGGLVALSSLAAEPGWRLLLDHTRRRAHRANLQG
jgi:hypothetical protein